VFISVLLFLRSIRLYYEFQDVDVDGYTIGGRYRQVMVSAREMELSNLPAQSKTFVNQRFKYTHGYGITMTPVSEFTTDGLPNFLIKDIPPQTACPELMTKRPQIYYGELTDTPVYVRTSEEEFDYPKGDQNVYSRHAGTGGVPLGNFWRKFVFGWKFDGTRFLLSGYPGKESRVLFHRQIGDRIRTIAPFLKLDHDPYITVADGKLYWIVDAYTTSDYFPYGEPFSSREVIGFTDGEPRRLISRVSAELDGANYVRNSVKIVVDAYDGTVALYVFEETDPVLQVWRKIFPALFCRRHWSRPVARPWWCTVQHERPPLQRYPEQGGSDPFVRACRLRSTEPAVLLLLPESMPPGVRHGGCRPLGRGSVLRIH
jgi:hypothetical protein